MSLPENNKDLGYGIHFRSCFTICYTTVLFMCSHSVPYQRTRDRSSMGRVYIKCLYWTKAPCAALLYFPLVCSSPLKILQPSLRGQQRSLVNVTFWLCRKVLLTGLQAKFCCSSTTKPSVITSFTSQTAYLPKCPLPLISILASGLSQKLQGP